MLAAVELNPLRTIEYDALNDVRTSPWLPDERLRSNLVRLLERKPVVNSSADGKNSPESDFGPVAEFLQPW